MITNDSRYFRRNTNVHLNADGRSILEIEPGVRQAWGFNFAQYRWRLGDRIDRLSYREFGDARMYWIISEANPEILDWTRLTPGTVIRLPAFN